MDGMDIGLVQEIFHPNAKYLEEEKRRLEHTRVAEGGHEPGCGPVDLDSGTVVVMPSDDGAVLPPRVREEEYTEGDGGEPQV